MMAAHRSSQHSTPPRHFVALSPSRGRKGKRCFVLLPSQGGARVSGKISCFPLRGNAALAAKGCTRLRVEKKSKGSPDRQTAACFWGMPLAVLAVQHPRATTWPSPPQGGARFSGALCSCHLQWGRGQRHSLLFPLEGKCRAAAKGCTRLRVEMKRKGSPDHQTAASLGGVSFEALAVQHPRATSWPSPPKGGARFRGVFPKG